MALQTNASATANIHRLSHTNTPSNAAPARAAQDIKADTYTAPAPRRTWHRARPTPAQQAARAQKAAPLRQGGQRAGKSIGDTIVNSMIFGFFASCGSAAFNSMRGACC